MAPREQKLTEYERKRLENIKKNEQMMAALKIQAKVDLLSSATKRGRVETKSFKAQPEKKLKSSNLVVIRRSRRTRGLAPDSKGLKDDFVESEGRIQKSPSPPTTPLRVLGPLKIRDVSTGSESDSTEKLLQLILSIAKTPQAGLSDKDEINEIEACKDENIFLLSENNDEGGGQSEYLDGSLELESDAWGSLDLDKLYLRSENVARIMPGRITVVTFFPSTDLRMIVAGNKFGNVGFWNVDSKDEDNGIFLYQPHSGPTSGILIQQSSMSKIITSCYDGFIRLMDAEKQVFDLIHSIDSTIFSLSQRPDDVMGLYFGEGYGGLNIWDLRTRKSTANWDLHEDRINTIDFNPLNPFIMATSSTDGTASLWDLRKMNAGKRKTLKMVSHERAVHSAYFSPSGSCLATTSLDNHVRIVKGVNFEETSTTFHNNQTGRWISSFRAIWGWDDSYLFIGNMKRGVDVISSTKDRTVLTLESEHMSAIPCRFTVHPCEVGTLAGATSGGQVYMWTSS